LLWSARRYSTSGTLDAVLFLSILPTILGLLVMLRGYESWATSLGSVGVLRLRQWRTLSSVVFPICAGILLSWFLSPQLQRADLVCTVEYETRPRIHTATLTLSNVGNKTAADVSVEAPIRGVLPRFWIRPFYLQQFATLAERGDGGYNLKMTIPTLDPSDVVLGVFESEYPLSINPDSVIVIFAQRAVAVQKRGEQ